MVEIHEISRTDTAKGISMTRGVHHLALTTEDMKTTTEFYVRVVGMNLVHAIKVPPGLGAGPGNRGNPPFEEIRHYFFDMGNDSLLAFFEIPKNEKKQSDRDDIGGMQHVAFSLTVERFTEIQSRLTEHGVEFDGPMDILPGLQSIYFHDPNGIRLEACCQPSAGEVPDVIGSVIQSAATARLELDTLDAGEAWVAEMIRNL
mgnify:CR=1 FL=1